jgi:hypothetical protein
MQFYCLMRVILTWMKQTETTVVSYSNIVWKVCIAEESTEIERNQ